jgi:hypothetical protein
LPNRSSYCLWFVYLFADLLLLFGFVLLQIAISASNTGGAWDNAKKYIEVSLEVIISEVAGVSLFEQYYVVMRFVWDPVVRLVLQSMLGPLAQRGLIHTRQL